MDNATEWDIELKNGTEPSIELDDNIMAKMHIPESILKECSTATRESIRRLAYSAFYTPALFPSSSGDNSTSVILSIQSNCLNLSSELSSPVSALYYPSEEVYHNTFSL